MNHSEGLRFALNILQGNFTVEANGKTAIIAAAIIALMLIARIAVKQTHRKSHHLKQWWEFISKFGQR